MTRNSESTPTTVPLKDFPGYEIETEYPHTIYVQNTRRNIAERNNGNGYIRVTMNGKQYYKHRVIALQFVPNPDCLSDVDHINRNRDDNHIENLRWCTHQQNCNNRGNNETVDDIPNSAIEVTEYSEYRFKYLYFYDDTFYFWNGINYVVKRKYLSKGGVYHIRVTDIEGVNRKISYAKFKREYELQ